MKRSNINHSSETSEPLKMETTRPFETRATTHPAVYRHISEERNFLLHRYESFQNFGKWGPSAKLRCSAVKRDRQKDRLHKYVGRQVDRYISCIIYIYIMSIVCIDEHGWMDGQTGKQTETNGRTDGRTDGQKDRYT